MMGRIFDIKRFAVHDGSGIRSTLFLKGCPLRCPWCQNPEGISAEIALWHWAGRCIQCGICETTCQRGAISLKSGSVVIDQKSCIACGKCATACPGAALELEGREISAQEAFQMLRRDRVFFGENGGVTLSGGEVFAQPDFAKEVLSLCKEDGLHTAIETCLFTSLETIERFLPVVDQWIVDIKYMDEQKHLNVIGADNQKILKNVRYLISEKVHILVRTPLIPGYTATVENISAIANFLASIDPQIPYELLNFNPLCRSKYHAKGEVYPVEGGAFSPQELEKFYAILEVAKLQNIVKE